MAYIVVLTEPAMEIYIKEPLVQEEYPEDGFKTPGEARQFNDVKIRQNLMTGEPFHVGTTFGSGQRIVIFWSRVAFIQRISDADLTARLDKAKADAEAARAAGMRPPGSGGRIAPAGLMGIGRIPGRGNG
jgi:hypothetical protein